MPLYIEGHSEELPLATLDEDQAVFASTDYVFGGQTAHKMPRSKWVDLGRPFKINVIVQLINEETT